nr:hypothetical protein CFP56_23907 [Quercus suber]
MSILSSTEDMSSTCKFYKMPRHCSEDENASSQAHLTAMPLKLLVRPLAHQSNRAQSNVGLVQSSSTSRGQGRKASRGQPNNKMESAKCTTKNKQARRAIFTRQQTLDSSHSSSTILDAATTCATDMSDMDMGMDDSDAAKAERAANTAERLPQPYDGLLAPGEDRYRSPSWLTGRAAEVRRDRYKLFRTRRQRDWRSIPVFYEDDEENDGDETYISHYFLNPLRRIKSPTGRDREAVVEEKTPTRR